MRPIFNLFLRLQAKILPQVACDTSLPRPIFKTQLPVLHNEEGTTIAIRVCVCFWKARDGMAPTPPFVASDTLFAVEKSSFEKRSRNVYLDFMRPDLDLMRPLCRFSLDALGSGAAQTDILIFLCPHPTFLSVVLAGTLYSCCIVFNQQGFCDFLPSSVLMKHFLHVN